MIKINNTDISDIKINDSSVSKVMVGSTQVWPISGPGPQDYIQEDLVFQLDGIDKGDNEGYWTDLIQGCKYDISNAQYVFSNCVQYSNTPSECDQPILLQITDSRKDFTYEMCVELEQNQQDNNHIVLCSTQSDAANLGINPQINRITAIAAPYHAQYASCENIPTKCTITYEFQQYTDGKNKRLYINSTAESIVNADRGRFNPLVNSGSSIGGSIDESSQYQFYGKIYAIRIYNRYLTEEEILHNQQLDMQRFGIDTQLVEE